MVETRSGTSAPSALENRVEVLEKRMDALTAEIREIKLIVGSLETNLETKIASMLQQFLGNPPANPPNIPPTTTPHTTTHYSLHSLVDHNTPAPQSSQFTEPHPPHMPNSNLGGTEETSDLLPSQQAELAGLLSQFSDIFAEPRGLPPFRLINHDIPLKAGTDPISVCPYWYNYFQKNEIEKLVGEMLSAGIIQPSISPYFSPTLLVKKKDDIWRFCVDSIRLKFPDFSLEDKAIANGGGIDTAHETGREKTDSIQTILYPGEFTLEKERRSWKAIGV